MSENAKNMIVLLMIIIIVEMLFILGAVLYGVSKTDDSVVYNAPAATQPVRAVKENASNMQSSVSDPITPKPVKTAVPESAASNLSKDENFAVSPARSKEVDHN